MDASVRSRSAIFAVAIHLGLFLIMLFTVMSTTIPPFPETGGGGGVIVNIGTVDEASGEVQPMSEHLTDHPSVNTVQPAPAEEENIATQETEESPVAHEKKEIKKPNVKPVKVDVKPKVTEVKPEPVKTVDPGSIYKGKTTNSHSQGTGHGTGDQGDPNGDPLSKYTGKNGSGVGPGNGPGEGPGQGPGKGGGISFSLAGRRMVRTPQVSDRSQETGKVVVDITVDKDGNVTAATPGGRGSTTTSSYLYRLATEAALKAKFTPNADAADIQKGTMTFVFIVQ